MLAQIWHFLLADLFEHSPMHDCSALRNKSVSSPFATLENTIIILSSPPQKKFCITIVFSFSWDLESPQKKLKLQWLCKMFFFGGGGTKRLLRHFLKWPILFLHKIVKIQEFCYYDKGDVTLLSIVPCLVILHRLSIKAY